LICRTTPYRNTTAMNGIDMQNNSIQEYDVVVALAALDGKEL
jgi:hypothetical protein